MQCSNNQRQLGLAIHNYDSAFKTFPATITGHGVPGNSMAGGCDPELLPAPDSGQSSQCRCCRDANPDPTYSAPHGKAWISGLTIAGNLYTHVMSPNRRNCHVYGGESDGNNMVAASSMHGGGIHVTYADGHTTFMSNNVEPYSWWSIGSRNGAEVTSELD